MHSEWTSLDSKIEVEVLTFNQIMEALRIYTEALLLDDNILSQLGVSSNLRIRSLDISNSIKQWDDANDSETRAAARVNGWRLHDESLNGDKTFAAVLVLCTYDYDRAEFNTFGPESMMESVMTSVCVLGEGFGEAFAETLIRVVQAQKQ